MHNFSTALAFLWPHKASRGEEERCHAHAFGGGGTEIFPEEAGPSVEGPKLANTDPKRSEDHGRSCENNIEQAKQAQIGHSIFNNMV